MIRIYSFFIVFFFFINLNNQKKKNREIHINMYKKKINLKKVKGQDCIDM